VGLLVRRDRGGCATPHFSLRRAQVVCDCRRFQIDEELSQNFSIEFTVVIEKAVRYEIRARQDAAVADSHNDHIGSVESAKHSQLRLTLQAPSDVPDKIY